MLGAFSSAVGVVATVLLAVAAALGRALTPSAAGVAAVFGITIVLAAGFGFLALLAVFVAVSSLATRYRFEEKEKAHVQEGRRGERGVSNVLAHIVLPATIALSAGLGWLSAAAAALLFSCALAFALSDTLASEFGVLTGHAVSILSFRPVVPGTNGGVSGVGTGAAAVAAAGTAVAAVGLFALFRTPFGPPATFLLLVAVAGFVACQVDSILGATLENRGLLTKGSTNFLGMLSAIALGAGVVLLSGRPL